MNVRTLLLGGTVFVLALLSGCTNANQPNQSSVTPTATNITGVVVRNDNLTPIANAIVYDIAGLARDTSRSDGTFRMVYQLLSQTKTTIIGSRSGFGNDTAFVTLNPGVDTTISLRLRADSTSPSGPISSGKAANIVLIASTSETPPLSRYDNSLKNRILSLVPKFPLSNDCKNLMILISTMFVVCLVS